VLCLPSEQLLWICQEEKKNVVIAAEHWKPQLMETVPGCSPQLLQEQRNGAAML